MRHFLLLILVCIGWVTIYSMEHASYKKLSPQLEEKFKEFPLLSQLLVTYGASGYTSHLYRQSFDSFPKVIQKLLTRINTTYSQEVHEEITFWLTTYCLLRHHVYNGIR